VASEEPAPFTREELLGSRSPRRATTLLFAIESRTAHLVARTPRAVPIVLSEQAARRGERAFLGALGQGRDALVQPSIQDLERHAPEWADLVPADPGIRAAVAQLLGEKHRFTRRATPQLRAALGIDSDAVSRAYDGLYGRSIDTIYAPRARPVERVRWTASRLAGRLDTLPAFWLAFFVTLIIGAVNLALPIAVSGVGALPGVVLIVVLGLINVVTIVAMVEVVTRSGSIRYGNAFIGTVVAEYLGGASSALLSIVLTAFSFGLLLIFYVGISTTLADATPLPASLWMIVLFGVGLYFLTRGSLNATVASTIVITTINVALLLVICALALPHVRLDNLAYVNLPWSGGGSFSPLLLGALVGVVLDIYAAHILVAIFGKMLLERDPTGRSVVRGHATGIGFAMLLNVLWVLVVCGAVAPGVLANESSTALVPLAAAIGPQVQVLGALFVILSMGLGLIQFSLALFNLARERIGQRFAGAGSRGQFMLALTPVVGVVLVAEWMVLTGTGSFTGILGFIGVIVHSLMSGIFPALLLVASRRKGELVPGVSYRILGHPLVVGGVYVLSLSNLLLHGLLVWEHPLQRVGGLFVGLLVMGVTIAIIRRGAFAPRVIVELREDRRRAGRSRLAVVSHGQPVSTEIRLTDAEGRPRTHHTTGELPELATLRSLAVELPAGPSRDLKVWAHTITPEGSSSGMAARVSLDGDDRHAVDLGQTGGQIVLPLGTDAHALEFTFASPPPSHPR